MKTSVYYCIDSQKIIKFVYCRDVGSTPTLGGQSVNSNINWCLLEKDSLWSSKNWKGKCPSFPPRSYAPEFMSFDSNLYCIFSGLVMRRHICVRPWNWINPTPIILWDSNQLPIKIQHIIWFYMDAKVLLGKKPFIIAEVWII